MEAKRCYTNNLKVKECLNTKVAYSIPVQEGVIRVVDQGKAKHDDCKVISIKSSDLWEDIRDRNPKLEFET